MHFNVDPNELTDDEWAKLFQYWVYTERIKMKAQETIIEKAALKALTEVAQAIFGKKK